MRIRIEYTMSINPTETTPSVSCLHMLTHPRILKMIVKTDCARLARGGANLILNLKTLRNWKNYYHCYCHCQMCYYYLHSVGSKLASHCLEVLLLQEGDRKQHCMKLLAQQSLFSDHYNKSISHMKLNMNQNKKN